LIPAPPSIQEIRRVEYDAATDTLYLAGFTADYPDVDPATGQPQFDSLTLGRVGPRYDGRAAGNRTPSQTYLPGRGPGPLHEAIPLSAAGGYLFVGYAGTAAVQVFDPAGNQVTTLTPGPEVGGADAALDMPFALQAQRRANGEFLIFAENDASA